MPNLTLAQLAGITQAELHGDSSCVIHGVASLPKAQGGQLSFLGSKAFRQYLPDTRASVVILKADDLAVCPCHALVTDNPSLAYAKAASALYKTPAKPTGIHPSAIVSQDAEIDPSACIGSNCTIGARVKIDAHVSIGPNCVVEAGCHIQRDSQLLASVTLLSQTILGERCLIHPGAVIGADGFGLANDQGTWVKIPQLGRAILGNDVEVGACTTIDRGALDDTVLDDGVKLDNHVHIGHNVKIGRHTAIVAQVGIAGSSKVGAQCTIAGHAGLNGHIQLADNVHISGMTAVTRSIQQPGTYTGTVPAMPYQAWRKNFARLKQLDEIARRLHKLEKLIS